MTEHLRRGQCEWQNCDDKEFNIKGSRNLLRTLILILPFWQQSYRLPPAAFQISASARQTKQGVWWFILSLLRSPLSDISQKQAQPEMYKLNKQNSYSLFLNMDWSLQNNDRKK